MNIKTGMAQLDKSQLELVKWVELEQASLRVYLNEPSSNNVVCNLFSLPPAPPLFLW